MGFDGYFKIRSKKDPKIFYDTTFVGNPGPYDRILCEISEKKDEKIYFMGSHLNEETGEVEEIMQECDNEDYELVVDLQKLSDFVEHTLQPFVASLVGYSDRVRAELQEEWDGITDLPPSEIPPAELSKIKDLQYKIADRLCCHPCEVEVFQSIRVYDILNAFLVLDELFKDFELIYGRSW